MQSSLVPHVAPTLVLDLSSLPRPPDAAVVEPVMAPRARMDGAARPMLRPATDLLADWLTAYGAGESVPALTNSVVRAYLEPSSKPAPAARPAVFANLVHGMDATQGEVV